MADVTFGVVKKNGKPYVRMNAFGGITDMKVWKANTDKPYTKYAGMVIYLDDEMKKAL